jgi:hypothetical protein
MKLLRLLKIDSVHPPEALADVQKRAGMDLEGMSCESYYDWLMSQRLNLSDYLTKPMRDAGWEAREFVPADPLLLRKMREASEKKRRTGLVLKGFGQFVVSLTPRAIASRKTWELYRNSVRSRQIAECIEEFRPDVLFIREPCHVDGRVLDAFRGKCLIVGMIACDPKHAWNWDASRHDVIFTATPEYRDYFRALGIRSEIVPFGVDERVAGKVAGLPKIHDCTFVGYLGAPHQRKKTELLARVAGETDLKWWGVKGPEIGQFPALERTYQGKAAGLDMLKIYKQSKIVVNDYPDFMQGHSNNMRNMEVFGVGSFLLTRAAEALLPLEVEGALVTFTEADDCVAKIKHYLENDEERERIATRGLEVALRDFNYKDITRQMMDFISETHDARKADLRW